MAATEPRQHDRLRAHARAHTPQLLDQQRVTPQSQRPVEQPGTRRSERLRLDRRRQVHDLHGRAAPAKERPHRVSLVLVRHDPQPLLGVRLDQLPRPLERRVLASTARRERPPLRPRLDRIHHARHEHAALRNRLADHGDTEAVRVKRRIDPATHRLPSSGATGPSSNSTPRRSKNAPPPIVNSAPCSCRNKSKPIAAIRPSRHPSLSSAGFNSHAAICNATEFGSSPSRAPENISQNAPLCPYGVEIAISFGRSPNADIDGSSASSIRRSFAGPIASELKCANSSVITRLALIPRTLREFAGNALIAARAPCGNSKSIRSADTFANPASTSDASIIAAPTAMFSRA